MADFIEGQQPQQPMPGPAGDFLSPQEKTQLGNQAASSVGSEQMPPQQMPQGAGLGETMENPLTAQEEPASQLEQEQYNDLFHRVVAMVNDTRQRGEQPSVAESVINMMATKGKEAHVAIGTVAAMVMMRIVDIARRAKVQYSNIVLQEVGIDLVVELTEIARDSGAIKNIPEEDSPPYQKLVELASLEMAKMYGEWLLQTGQADKQAAMKDLKSQMQREADSGALDDWGMEEIDPQIRQQIGQAAMAGGRPVQTGGQ